jgi:hypothetical protein
MASLNAALRFDGAVVDGPLPPPAKGVVRVLSQQLSPAVARQYANNLARWRDAQRSSSRATQRPPWARILSPLDDCQADAAHILGNLQRYLGLAQARLARKRPQTSGAL